MIHNPWEENFDEAVRLFGYKYSDDDTPNMYGVSKSFIDDQFRQLFKKEIEKVTLEYEEKIEPMGVSQWKEYGKKYGYWAYFETQLEPQINKQARTEALEELERQLPPEEPLNGTYHGIESSRKNGWNNALKKVNEIIKSLK